MAYPQERGEIPCRNNKCHFQKFGRRRKEAILEKEKQAQKLETELIEQQLSHQKNMTGISIQAQEKERNELGKELHDNINQILGTVKLYLGMIINKVEVPEDILGLSYRYLNDAIEEIRILSKSLVTPSLGDTSLEEALHELVNRFNITKDLTVELHYNFESDQRIDKEVELMIYRIVQEQINNIRKYSQSPTAIINIRSLPGQNLSLEITDQGVGFDTKQKVHGIGLKNIHSRVEYYSGSVNVISSPGKGCKLAVAIPLNKVA
jgi:two-component system, NarL family, sensor histidine kinase UhpB